MKKEPKQITGLVHILDAFIEQNKKSPMKNIDGTLKSLRQYVIDLTSNN